MLTKKDFQFGIELEGYFSPALIRKLQRELPKNVKYKLKMDGSVSISDEELDNWSYDGGFNWRDGRGTEINLGVFKKYEDLIKVIKFFDAENYLRNDTCGIHIHISPKGRRIATKTRYIKGLIQDWSFIKDLQEYAIGLNPKIENRLKYGRWCHLYKSLINTRRTLREGVKYQFMRNHRELGTFEFRFFDSGEDKVKNIEDFFNHFFEKINDEKITKKCRKVRIKFSDLNKEVNQKYKIEMLKTFKDIYKVNRYAKEPLRLTWKIRVSHKTKKPDFTESEFERQLRNWDLNYPPAPDSFNN